MTQHFALPAVERLKNFLTARGQFKEIELLTPDASTRDYFRVFFADKTAIACVYPEPFSRLEHNYFDSTRLFLAANLPVAEIYDSDEKLGIIILEDLGDALLRDELSKAEFEKKEKLYDEAINLIAKIQAATAEAFATDSIAARLKFDEEKLSWELNFFKTHYFESLQKKKLSVEVEENLSAEFSMLARRLETRAKVLCHRDFHAANLMIDRAGRMRIIDHQDARIGAASYDLVSLLLDRIEAVPARDWIDGKISFFLGERDRLNLEKMPVEEFSREFDSMTVQRCLKAIGTFSFQAANRGKIHYIKYIEPMFRAVLEACERLNEFENLQKIIRNEIYQRI